MNLYVYDGPVLLFNTLINEHWYGETMAVSEKKAKSNLAYQYKKEYNYTPDSKIVLPGDLYIVTEGEE